MALEDMARVLIEAGASPAQAARGAVLIEQEVPVSEVYETVFVAAAEPATFDVELLMAQVRRELVSVRRAS